MFPGYPVWLLATVSYLLSEDGADGRDCVDRDGCSTADCGRFVPRIPDPLNPLAPLIGGYRSVCTQNLVLMIRDDKDTDTCIIILSHSGAGL